MLKVVTTVLHVIFSLGLIATVLLMSGRSAGLSGAISGGAETFFGKRKGLDELLGKLAAGFAMAFLVSSLVLSFLTRYL
ncbi:MAG: preprotein translocase subunit SecG [Firmicutes bacterium]|nr:preprotein translocase subunit SecG [Bacillota bacterium]